MQSTKSRVVHGQHRLEAEVGRIDDVAGPAAASWSCSKSPRSGSSSPAIAHAQPVAAVRRVAAVAAVPHHRHAQRHEAGA